MTNSKKKKNVLRTDDDSAFLRELIRCTYDLARPKLLLTISVCLQEVDSSYNDGWWVGVIF
ncbi:hypothetical protein GBA52_018883 [Prunus armeniaca]|nr:hypothetical protein GBA52_018883 [Prunus armeniaca]